jgi:hypothetical protein
LHAACVSFVLSLVVDICDRLLVEEDR